MSPHLPWPTVPAKKARVAFIVPRWCGREVVELAQRYPIDQETVLLENSNALGASDFFSQYIEGTAQDAQQKRQETLLARNFDVYVIGGVRWDVLPQKIRQILLARVSQGAGLLFVAGKHAPPAWTDTKDFHPEAATPSVGELLCGGLPLADLPPYAKMSADAIGRGYHYENGRLLSLHSATSPLALTPQMNVGALPSFRYEAALLLVARALEWVQQKTPPLVLSAAESALAKEGGCVRLKVLSSSEACTRNIRLQQYRAGICLDSVTKQVRLDAGATEIEVPFTWSTERPDWLRVEIADAADSFAWSVCPAPSSPSILSSVDVTPRVAAAGETLRIHAQWGDTATGGYKLRFRLHDSTGGVVSQTHCQVTSQNGDIGVSLPVGYPHELCRTVEVAVLSPEDRVIQEQSRPVYLRRTADNSFPTIAWSCASGSILDTLVRWRAKTALGVNGLYGAFTDHATQQRVFAGQLQPVVQIASVGSYGPVASLKRSPSLSDETWRKKYLAGRESLCERLRAYPLPIISLGCESNLGFIGAEFDRSPVADAGFRSYIEMQNPDLSALASRWKTALPAPDGIVGCSLPEAKERNAPLHWLDFRTYLDGTFMSLQESMARIVREQFPETTVGLTSCQEMSSFHGYDWHGATLGMVGAHADRFFIPLLEGSLPPKTMLPVWTGGYLATQRAFGSRMNRTLPWWSVLHGSRSLFLFSLVQTPESMLAPDLSVMPDLTDTFVPAMRELQDGLGWMLAQSTPVPPEAVVLHSQSSMHLNTVLSENSRCSTAAARWWYTRLLAAGFHTGIADIRRYSSPASALPRILALPQIRQLPAGFAQRLIAHVNAGGVVLYDTLPEEGDALGEDSTNSVPGLLKHLKTLTPVHAQDSTWGIRREGSGAWIQTSLQTVDSPSGFVAQRELPASQQWLGWMQSLLDSWVPPEAESIRALRTVLAEVGAAPRITMTSNQEQCTHVEVIRRRFSDSTEILALVPDPRVDWSGRTDIRVSLPAPMYAYDLRAHRALGKTDVLTMKASLSESMVFALEKNPPQPWTLTAQRTTTAAGMECLHVHVECEGKPGTQLWVSLRLMNEDGVPVPGKCAFLCLNARSQDTVFDIPLALHQRRLVLVATNLKTGQRQTTVAPANAFR